MFTIIEQTEADVLQREAWATPEQAAAWYPAASAAPIAPTVAVTAAASPSSAAASGPTPMLSTKASTLDPASLPLPITGASSASASASASASPLSSKPFAVVACIAGLTTVAASMANVLEIRSDATIPQYLGDYTISDLDGVGTNFRAAFLIAGLLMLLGGLLARQPHRERFGAGLGGGAGAAIVPLVAFAATGANSLADRALEQAEYLSATGASGTTFEFTLPVGFFVLLAAAVFGVATLVAAVRFGREDNREPLNTSLCVVGAIGCVIAGAGQLVPGVGARFADNFSNPYSVGAFVYSRLAMIAVMVVLGVLGFLLASRFGLGLAIGAVSVYTWQWASSLFEVGNLPLPPAIFNPGGDGKPHIVTTLGVAMALVCLAVHALVIRRADSATTA